MPEAHPVFAVVGHPNKGKSSVVAALTQNDQVSISPVSGTTRLAQHFSLKLDRRVVFELVDTPGFQRASSCYRWLMQQNTSADQKPLRVQAFVDAFKGGDQFIDEVELLQPIMDGAGIIYVVDGSLPYSGEYETEMRILRWTGRPRLALINPIGSTAYVQQWQAALNQYFSLVRVFDPMQAGFAQHLQLLRAFGQLEPDAESSFDQAILELERYRDAKLQQAARLIVDGLHSLLIWQTSGPVLPEAAQQLKQQFVDEVRRFNRQLNRMEQENRQQLEALFLYHGLDAHLQDMHLAHGELMDQEKWSFWGLQRGQLVVVTAGAGAALGLVADAGLGGASLMTGAISGGVLGGVSGWLGTDWLKDKLPAWMRATTTTRVIGPIKDPNFAFVILGRALGHAQAVLARSYAARNTLEIPGERLDQMQQLDTRTQIRLLRLCRELQKEGLQSKAAGSLQKWVMQRLQTAEPH